MGYKLSFNFFNRRNIFQSLKPIVFSSLHRVKVDTTFESLHFLTLSNYSALLYILFYGAVKRTTDWTGKLQVYLAAV